MFFFRKAQEIIIGNSVTSCGWRFSLALFLAGRVQGDIPLEWTPEKIQGLGELWAEGRSPEEIGQEIGTTERAVTIEARRLNLPVQRNSCLSMPPPKEQTKGDPASVAPTPLLGRERHHIDQCCWPIGDPRKASFHLCGNDTEPGKPYCPDHAMIAYLRPERSVGDIA